MKDLSTLFYLLGGVLGILFLCTLLWEVSTRFSRKRVLTAPPSPQPAEEPDPFQRRLKESGAPPIAEMNPVKKSFTPDPVVPQEERRKEHPPTAEFPEPEDPWKALMRNQLKESTKLAREISLDSGRSEEEDKS